MKKNFLIALSVLLSINVHAQYKKASFLTKKGRTYDIGGAGHFISEGHSSVPGIIYSYGKENSEKRIFHWFDLELLMPAKFSYKTEEFTTKTPVTVSGKSKLGLIYRYNLAYYLINNSNPDNKLLPFVTGGLNWVITSGNANEVYMPNISTDVKKKFMVSDGNLGASFGVGSVYNITSTFGLKLTAGYSYQLNVNAGEDSYKSEGYSLYYVFPNHPYVTLGVRFRMDRDDD
jgi:hypothetical protein